MTTKKNILIAEFMNWDSNESKTVYYEPTDEVQGIGGYDVEDLPFNNLNWLMEVVGKIISTKETYAEERQKVFKAICPDVNVVYDACIEFILYYNEHLEDEIENPNKRNINLLFAQFLGAAEKDLNTFDMYGIIESIDDVENEQHYFTINEMPFDSDWNWLMEVVQKIESLDFIVSIHHEVVNIFNGECYVLEYNETTQSKTKLITVYNACVNFITWYNQQSK